MSRDELIGDLAVERVQHLQAPEMLAPNRRQQRLQQMRRRQHEFLRYRLEKMGDRLR